jgi:hypothetical protein
MKKGLFALLLLSAAADPVHAQQAIVQFGPTTEFSTLACGNFAKLPDGKWKALNPTKFGLGFVTAIVPPGQSIALGGYIYNNIDLYSQLNMQCSDGVAVTARY